MAYKLACNQELKNYTITPAEVKDLLGNPPFNRDIYQGNDYAGVVTGLAWTSVGGEILYIETSLSKGKAGKLTLTGNLGDVMKESAIIALEYVKSHIDLLQVDYRIFEQWNIHIHVPEGATPKDGPSAGITIATSIASAITQRKVRANTAMIGRDNPPRQSAPGRRNQGEDSGSQAGRNQAHRDVQGEPEERRGNTGEISQGRRLPLCRECG